MPEFFPGSVHSNAALRNMLIRVNKHPDCLTAIRLASTLGAASVAVVANVSLAHPVAPHNDGSIDAELMMDFDVLITLSEHRCRGVLPR